MSTKRRVRQRSHQIFYKASPTGQNNVQGQPLLGEVVKGKGRIEEATWLKQRYYEESVDSETLWVTTMELTHGDRVWFPFKGDDQTDESHARVLDSVHHVYDRVGRITHYVVAI